ncbi:MAG TPA: aromatic ring-hydroxylating dioxygenase subunit alpha [Steroidobacteraceae bacterium]|nr:aromatic ring-hydroxylating dioxygenase subunit alpha [Steroidobacteraceae bacterium]
MALPAPSLVRAARVAMNQMADRNTPFVENEWYVVAFAAELQRSLLKRTVLGRHIVMFRTEAGMPVALDDRCPHRSYPLSAGILDGDTVICGYHGLRYDAAGDCIEVPSQKTCPKGIGVRSYPLVESGPFVWGWLGDAPADPARIPATPWLTSNDWVSSQGYFHLAGNYVSLHENLLDLTHLSYVHANSFGTPEYASSPFELSLEEGHYRITRRVIPTRLPPVWSKPTQLEHDHAARIATSEFRSPGLHVVTVNFYDCELPEGNRPEFLIRTSHVPTPETHGSTHYFIVHSRDFAQTDTGVTDFMHEQLFLAFREDVEALTRLEATLEAPGEPFYEISIASDAPAVAMRRYLKRRALAERPEAAPGTSIASTQP